MAPRTETGWAINASFARKSHSKKKGGAKHGRKSSVPKSKKGKPKPSTLQPPAEKYDSWWQNLKSQIRFIMTGQGKNNMLTDAENVYLSIDPDLYNAECAKHKKSFIRSMWSKLTPLFMKYTPQIFNIKSQKSSEKNIQDWLEAMPEPENRKTDANVEALWWPTTEEKVTEFIEDASPAKSAYVNRKDRKPTGKVDPLLKMYSNTTQLVPFKDASRSLVDLRTLETKRRNRVRPKNRFSKHAKKSGRGHHCADA